MKALVTGFEPFGGESVNPSGEAVARLPARIGKLQVATAIVPTSFATALPELEKAIVRHRPDIVLCVGQAGGRVALSLERVAINVQDARIADNDGAQPIDVPVIVGGPAAYFTGLPVKAAVAALRRAGLPAEVSNTAGTFVCNHIFYGLMHIAAKAAKPIRGGFLHIPLCPEQAAHLPGQASMSLDDIARGIAVILKTTATVDRDLVASEGRVS